MGSERVEERRILLKSYSKVWKIERILYNLGGWNLPSPLALNTLIYWVGFAILMKFVGMLPLIGQISPMYRYLLIPGALAWFFNNKLLDGKNPFAFMRSILIHIFVITTKGHIISKFRYIKPKNTKVIFTSKISSRIITRQSF